MQPKMPCLTGGGSCDFQPSFRGGSLSFVPNGRGGLCFLTTTFRNAPAHPPLLFDQFLKLVVVVVADITYGML